MNPALQSVLENPAIWRGGDLPAAAGPALASGFSALDAQLPGGGWPVGALTEILSGPNGIGELSLLLPFLSRVTREGQGVVWVAPPYLPYAPALAAAGVELERSLIVMPPRSWRGSPCPSGSTAALTPSPSSLFTAEGRTTLPSPPGRRVGDEGNRLPLTPSPSPAGRGELRAAFGWKLERRGEDNESPRGDFYGNALWVMEQALRSGACGAVLGWLDDLGTRPDYRALRRLQLAAEAGGAAGFLYRPPTVAKTPSPAPLRLNLAVEDVHLVVRILKRRGAAGCAPLRLAVQGLRRRNEAGPSPDRSSERASSERVSDVRLKPNLALPFDTSSPQSKAFCAY